MLGANILEHVVNLLVTLAVIPRGASNHEVESSDLCNVVHEQPFTVDAGSQFMICVKIAESMSSSSQVFYPGSLEFITGTSHWASSKSQVSACSVEPETPQEVGNIIRELASTRTPFAVKGGGHSLNPGFSSTPGVHISLRRMNDIVIHEDSKTVDIGAGLTWTDVYAYLVPRGINVVGARLGKVGVAGFTLGGGYSWKTSQYGLAVDNVVGYELVLPSGQVKVVTEKDEDLWFALKGGFNNYGIVTKFTFKFHNQTDVWAASLNFVGDLMEDAKAAFAKFLTREHDHKGAQQAQFIYINGTVVMSLSLFYDGPEPPEGLYDELLQLSTLSRSIFKGSFTDFITGTFLPTFPRGYFDGIPMVRFTQPVIEAHANESKFWGEALSKYDENVVVVYTFDQYEPGFLTHGGPSAYPPDRSRAFLTSNIFVGWSEESVDKLVEDAVRSSRSTLIAAGIRDGQDLKNAVRYPNYALFGTAVEEMYGEHVGRLRQIRKKYDPFNIMGLAGGWKI